MKSFEIQNKYQVSPLIAEVLASGSLNEKQINQILYPQEDLSSCQCESLDYAVKRILKAKANHEKVFIGGDYDADGICATTILKETLDALGIENGFYIPNRFTQGYGLHPDTVKMVKQKGYNLIITVDNGVACKEAIETAHHLNMEVLVTDHHTIDQPLNWDGLVHPSNLPEGFNSLCGAGVALQISRKLIHENRRHVILAMVATLADMMPVFDENRWIIRKGLEYLNADRMPQLEALLERPVKFWTEKEISFQIVPKINAVGRLADLVNPNNVVRYFLLTNQTSIEEAAKQIKEVNQQRRKLSEKMAEIASSKVTEDLFCIVEDEEFHEGLVGLVANRLMMQLKKPVAVFARKDGICKGSVRSYGNLDLIDFFQDLKPMLLQFGGHKAAAGIAVSVDKFSEFEQAVQLKMKNIEIKEEPKSLIFIDSVFCTASAVNELKTLAPYGQGFEAPVFAVGGFEVCDAQILKDRYPKWRLSNSDFDFEAISFSLNKEAVNAPVKSFIGQLEVNEFRGRKTVSIIVEDLKNS